MAEWQSGYAADCNSVYAGSIPTSASNLIKDLPLEDAPWAYTVTPQRGCQLIPTSASNLIKDLPLEDAPWAYTVTPQRGCQLIPTSASKKAAYFKGISPQTSAGCRTFAALVL